MHWTQILIIIFPFPLSPRSHQLQFKFATPLTENTTSVFPPLRSIHKITIYSCDDHICWIFFWNPLPKRIHHDLDVQGLLSLVFPLFCRIAKNEFENCIEPKCWCLIFSSASNLKRSWLKIWSQNSPKITLQICNKVIICNWFSGPQTRISEICVCICLHTHACECVPMYMCPPGPHIRISQIYPCIFVYI